MRLSHLRIKWNLGLFFFFKQCKEESYVYVFRAMYIEKTNSLTYGPINPIISDQANTSQLLRKKKKGGEGTEPRQNFLPYYKLLKYIFKP